MEPFIPLVLEDRERFNAHRQHGIYEGWEMNFTNLFIWKDSWRLMVAQDELALYIRGYDKYLKSPFVFPPIALPGAFAQAVRRLERVKREEGLSFLMRGVTEEMKQQLEQAYPGRYLYQASPETTDYVYQTQSLATLSGKKLSSKRNHINKFYMEYPDFEYAPITVGNLEECMALNDQWLALQPRITWDLEDEHLSVREMLDHYQALGVTGGLIRVKGKVVAFTIGEMITPEMAIIHIEKADERMPGLFTVINRLFVENAWGHTQWINREDDMGLPGLRRAKESYNPARRIQKYDVVPSAPDLTL